MVDGMSRLVVCCSLVSAKTGSEHICLYYVVQNRVLQLFCISWSNGVQLAHTVIEALYFFLFNFTFLLNRVSALWSVAREVADFADLLLQMREELSVDTR